MQQQVENIDPPPESPSLQATQAGTSIPFPARKIDPGLLLIATLLIALAVFAGWVQKPTLNPLAPTTGDRWLRPIEFNPQGRFPLLPPADLHALWFFSREEALAGGASRTLLRTTDAGRTWNSVSLSPPLRDDGHEGIHALKFSKENPLRGFLVGQNELCLATQDGGVTWETFEVRLNASSNRQIANARVMNARQTTEAKENLPALPQAQRAQTADIYDLALKSDGEIVMATSQGLWRQQSRKARDDVKGGGAENLREGFEQVSDREAWGVVQAPWEWWWLGPQGIGDAIGAPVALPSLFLSQYKFDAIATRDQTLFFAGEDFLIVDEPALARYDDEPVPPENIKPAGVNPAGVSLPTEAAPRSTADRIWACDLGSERVGWAVGHGGKIHRVEANSAGTGFASQNASNRPSTKDRVRPTVIPRHLPSFTRSLYAVKALSPDEVVVAGDEGAIFRTHNGGLTWEPLTANCWPPDAREKRGYGRLPALWFYPLCGLLGWLGYRRWQTRPGRRIVHDAIAAELTTDRAVASAAEDRLDFVRMVQGLSRYLRNAATQPPLTLAITGAWGSGKSSFMNLLRANLESHGLSTVWFNAWHHQQEPQILAPLLQSIRSEAAPSFFSRQVDVALRFRLRLLWRRLKEQRLLVFALLTLLCLGLGLRRQLEGQPFTALAKGIELVADENSALEGLGNLVGGGSFIGLVAGLGLLAWRVLTLFGVNPASLLASESGKSSQLALSEQTNFRREFAARFREVTDALKPYPLVVFIDDLDRCEADKVFQILEAINYLVSSGDCFVVLGMSEERVRDSVALGFKDYPPDFSTGDIAAANDRGDSTNGDNESNEDPWRQQRALAQNYLEKLIQLRVDLKPPNADGIRRLAQPPARASELVRGWRAAMRRTWEGWRYGVAWVALTAAVGSVAYFSGGAIATVMMKTDAAATASPAEQPSTPSPNVTPTSNQPAGSTRANAVASGTSTNVNAGPAPRFRAQTLPPTPTQAGTPNLYGGLAIAGTLILVAVLAALAQRELRRRQTTIVRDSSEFMAATIRWIDGMHRMLGPRFTPRALKRFKNRARYNAMVLREGGTAENRLPDRVIVTLGALDQLGIPPHEALDADFVLKTKLAGPLSAAAIEAAEHLRRADARTDFETAAQSAEIRA